MTGITLDTPIKFLRSDGSATHSGRRSYAKGRWLRKIKVKLKPCKNGYHTTTPRHWRDWADAQLWLVEARGGTLHGDTKSCHRTIKLTAQLTTWNETSARLLACQIAESVLHLTDDPRPRAAIEVARRFARGQATEEELRSASWAALAASAASAALAASEAASWAALAASEAASWAALAASEAASAALAASEAASEAASWATSAASAALAASEAASAASQLQHSEWFLATIRGEINQV